MKFRQFDGKSGNSSQSLIILLFEAMIGSFWRSFYLIEYMLTWFIIYPVLMFGSFYLLKYFIDAPVKDAGPFFWLTLLITQGAIFYFAYKIVARFINLERKSEEYFLSRYQIRLETFSFLLINSASYYLMQIPVMEQLKNNSDLSVDFAVFYVIYLLIVWRAKKWQIE
ncbi:MAG: hypothetical protein ACQETH_09135 [Candidatus Rifleibacteriota bacterium]